jgi:hypothetical protein
MSVPWNLAIFQVNTIPAQIFYSIETVWKNHLLKTQKNLKDEITSMQLDNKMKNEDELYSKNQLLNFIIFNAEKSQQQCNLGVEQNRERFSLTMTKSCCSEEDPSSILFR